MSTVRKNHLAFRPNLGDTPLEDRVVLSAAQTAHVTAAALRAPQAAPLVTAQQLFGLHNLYPQQFQAAYSDLRNFAFSQVIAAYDNAGLTPRGRLDATQLRDLLGTVSGAVNATALRLSAQYNLLPGTNALTNNLQNSLLGNSRNGLLTQLTAIGFTPRNLSSETALIQAVNRVLNTNQQANFNALANYFRFNNFNAELANAGFTNAGFSAAGVRAAAVSPTVINPLQGFMLRQATNQFNNNLGAFNSAIGNAALNTLFNGSATNPITTNAAALANFNNQVTSGLGTLNFQLGSALSAIPGLSNLTNTQQLFNNFRTGFFGNGTPLNPGLIGNITALPATNPSFSNLTNSVNGAFNTAFSNLAGPLFTLNGQTVPTVNPITGNFSNVLGSNFTSPNFFGGFNTGFGTGFTGLGTVPSNLSTFNTGFTGLVNNFTNTLGLGTPLVA
jgi:hypothetical protein